MFASLLLLTKVVDSHTEVTSFNCSETATPVPFLFNSKNADLNIVMLTKFTAN